MQPGGAGSGEQSFPIEGEGRNVIRDPLDPRGIGQPAPSGQGNRRARHRKLRPMNSWNAPQAAICRQIRRHARRGPAKR